MENTSNQLLLSLMRLGLTWCYRGVQYNLTRYPTELEFWLEDQTKQTPDIPIVTDTSMEFAFECGYKNAISIADLQNFEVIV